jgi:hypothetical protein
MCDGQNTELDAVIHARANSANFKGQRLAMMKRITVESAERLHAHIKVAV